MRETSLIDGLWQLLWGRLVEIWRITWVLAKLGGVLEYIYVRGLMLRCWRWDEGHDGWVCVYRRG